MTRTPAIALLAILASPALLAACGPVDMADYDPHQRYQVEVQSAVATATLAEPMGATDRQVVRDLAAEFLRRGAGAVTVEGKAADSVAEALAEAGIPRERIQAKTTDAAGAVVQVPVWQAKVPECGQWGSDGVNPELVNKNNNNFGCAITRNIGLMVADPADLVRARDSSGRDANRSVDVLGKYGQGKTTGSQAEEVKPTATISVVGK